MTSGAGFKAAWWLSNPHAQTLYPALFRKPPALNRQRERLTTPDGDFIDIDYLGIPRETLIILLHGLSGSSNSGYILGLQAELAGHAIASVAMNFRGCSGEPNHRARCYHSGETEDIDFVYRTLRQRYPNAAIGVVGFSLGGNVLLKWLGEHGDGLELRAAVAVSVPLVLSECATRLDRGLSKMYRRHLLDELKHYINCKRSHLDRLGLAAEARKLDTLGDISRIRSFWDYDNRVVAPLHGFVDVHDYYRRASARQFLSGIRVPTLIIQARDDPFMTPKVLTRPHELPPAVILEAHDCGGHVGFVTSGGLGRPRYWLDARIADFLKTIL